MCVSVQEQEFGMNGGVNGPSTNNSTSVLHTTNVSGVPPGSTNGKSGAAAAPATKSNDEDDLLTSTLVDADEIPALVRSAFEGDASLASGVSTSTSSLLSSLRRIVEKKEREVAEITKLHYEDFVRSVDELRMVKRYSGELRRQVQGYGGTIQASGEALYDTIAHAASLHRARNAIASEKKVLSAAVEVAQTLLKLQAQLAEKHFYAALRTLRALRQLAGPRSRHAGADEGTGRSTGAGASAGKSDVRGGRGRAPPAGDMKKAAGDGAANAGGADTSGKSNGGGGGGGGGDGGGGGSASGSAAGGGGRNSLPEAVRVWAQGLIGPAEAEVDRAAMQSFKDWLVHAREQQETVGRNAVMLGSGFRVTASASADGDAAEAPGESGSGGLDPATAALESMSIDFIQSSSVPLKQHLDVTPVYRCAHIYNALNRLDSLNTIYERERTLQLKMCFDFPSNLSFQAGYDKYISNIIGFFVVEDRVLRTAPGVTSSGHIDISWEDTTTALRETLISQIRNITSLPTLQSLSSFLNMTVSAVERFRLSTGVLMEALAAADKQIRDVLLSLAEQKVESAIEIDFFTPLEVHTPDEYHALVTEAELDVDGNIPYPNSFPAVLPFSSSVPVIAHVIKQAAQDCQKYLNVKESHFHEILSTDTSMNGGGVARGNDPRQRKETLGVMSEVIVRCCVEPLQYRLHEGEELSFSQVIGLCCNATVLEGLFSATFDAIDVGHLTKLKEDAEQRVVDIAKEKMAPFLYDGVLSEWNLDTVSDTPPTFMVDLVQFLSTVVGASATSMTGALQSMLYRMSVEHVCGVFIDVFSNNESNFSNLETGEKLQVKRWNMFGMMTLDMACRLLEEWYFEAISAASTSAPTIKIVLPPALSALRQIIDLFVNNKIEVLTEEVTANNGMSQHRDFNYIPVAKLCHMIDKYRDVSTVAIFQNYKGAKSFPKRRNLDQLARKLRALKL